MEKGDRQKRFSSPHHYDGTSKSKTSDWSPSFCWLGLRCPDVRGCLGQHRKVSVKGWIERSVVLLVILLYPHPTPPISLCPSWPHARLSSAPWEASIVAGGRLRHPGFQGRILSPFPLLHIGNRQTHTLVNVKMLWESFTKWKSTRYFYFMACGQSAGLYNLSHLCARGGMSSSCISALCSECVAAKAWRVETFFRSPKNLAQFLFIITIKIIVPKYIWHF